MGAFELPITQNAVLWLEDGRRLLVTESLKWYPSLWDGAALSSLPLAQGFSQLTTQLLQWPTADGRPLNALASSLRDTPPDAPLIVQLCDARDSAPLIASRASAATSARLLLPLLRMGYRLVQIDCDPSSHRHPAGADGHLAASVHASLAASLVADVIVGLDAYAADALSACGRSFTSVGVIGFGWGGLLALNALASSSRFSAGVCVGAPLSDWWLAMELGAATSAADTASTSADGGQEGTPSIGSTVSDGSRPLSAATTAAGMGAVLDHKLIGSLARTATPTLLLYGDADPICSISHAEVAYKALMRSSPQSQLVVYPGESHGLYSAAHHTDAVRRLCDWCLTHLSVAQRTTG